MPFIFIPPHVRFVEIIIDQKLIIFNMLHNTFINKEHEMIKMCARLLESLNGKQPSPDLNWQEMPNISNTLKNI
jgi:hypothetical protein